MSGAKDLPCSAAMRHIPQFSILLVVVGAAYEVPAEPIGSLAGKARRRSRLPHSSGGRVGSTNVRSDLPAASGDSVETERLTSFALLTEPRLRPAPSLFPLPRAVLLRAAVAGQLSGGNPRRVLGHGVRMSRHGILDPEIRNADCDLLDCTASLDL